MTDKEPSEETAPPKRSIGCSVFVAVILLALLATLFWHRIATRTPLAYTHFHRLVEASERLTSDGEYAYDLTGEQKTGEILVTIDGRPAQLSNLHDVVLNPDTITGELDLQRSFDGELHSMSFTVNRLEASESNADLVKRLNAYHIDWEPGSAPSIWWQVAPSLVVIIVFVALVGMIYFRNNNPSGFSNYSLHRATLIEPGAAKFNLEDLSQTSKPVKEARLIIDFLRAPEKYQRLGGEPPISALLVGPTGCGKTLLAHAIANEADVSFLSHAPTEFVDLFVGVGAARVRNLFKDAKRLAPCIVFIDEVDAIGIPGPNEQGDKVDERVQTAKALMLELDHLTANDRVFVLAATNRIDLLDPAFLRKGRMERLITFETPTEPEREQMLTRLLQNVALDSSVDLKKLAACTTGFFGADLAHVVNEAAVLAAQRGNPAVTSADFNDAITRIAATISQREKHAGNVKTA